MTTGPRLSVVLNFLNAESCIVEAVESVFAQTYGAWELVLIDDGSTDGSTKIARDLAELHAPRIRYDEHPGHENRGTSASRNLGIARARGPLIAFLDADDVWLPDKLTWQVRLLEAHPSADLVFHPALYWQPTGSTRRQPMALTPGALRTGAWISYMLASDDNAACPSTTLVKRDFLARVHGFENGFTGLYDDQVLWAKAALHGACLYDPRPVALYRIHAGSCCGAATPDQRLAARAEFHGWLLQYLATARADHCLAIATRARLVDDLVELARPRRNQVAERYRRDLGALFVGLFRIGALSRRTSRVVTRAIFAVSFVQATRHDGPRHGARALPGTMIQAARGALPRRLKRLVRRVAGLARAPFTRMRAAAGVMPLSDLWGFDRGFPVHRYYLERFLAKHVADVRGHCLEFQSDDYTTRFGGTAVTRLDILDLEDRNPAATLVGDLTTENCLPDQGFDCIVCTHVLHTIADLATALGELHRILKPGGVLLIAVPHVSMCGATDREFWRFTPDGLRSVLDRVFGPAHVTVEGYGNSLTAAGELRGLTADEFTQAELHANDPRFPVEVCARAVKAQ